MVDAQPSSWTSTYGAGLRGVPVRVVDYVGNKGIMIRKKSRVVTVASRYCWEKPVGSRVSVARGSLDMYLEQSPIYLGMK